MDSSATVMHVIASLNGRAIADVARTVADETAARGDEVWLVACHVSGGGTVPERAHLIDLGGSPRRTLPTVPRMTLALRDRRPAVVFAHGPGSARAVLLAVRPLASPPKVIAVTHNHYSSYAWDHPRLRRAMDARLLARAAAVVGVSPGVTDDLRRVFPAVAPRALTIPAPLTRATVLDTLAQEPVAHPWLDGRPLLVSVAHVHARKDQRTLVRMVAELQRRRGVDTPFVLVLGADDNSYAAGVKALARALGVDDRIDFLGAVRNPLPYVARAAGLVSTSRNEGLGLSILEALALGTPVVTTDAPSGPRWVLDDGRCGFLAPVGDVQALADATERLLEERELAVAMAAEGRRRARAFFPDRIADAYQHLASAVTGSPSLLPEVVWDGPGDVTVAGGQPW